MSRTRTAEGARFRPPAPSVPSLVLALARRLGRFAEALFRAWAYRHLAREIALWPDERLRDVGLSRADLGAAIAGLRRPYRWQPDCDPAKLDPSRFGH